MNRTVFCWPQAHSRIRTFLLVLGVVVSAVARNAAADTPFGIDYSISTRGNILLIGNTNRSSSGNIDIDSDGTTTNSSSADLSLPTGASVLFAGLYYMGRDTSPPPAAPKFKTPLDSSYQTITTPTFRDGVSSFYGAYKDVTSLVSAAGSGTYFVADIETAAGREAGWVLVVVYGLSSEIPRTMVVYGGAIAGSNAQINVSGFLTPPSGTVNVKIGMFSVQGESSIPGDAAIFAGSTLSNALNPSNNFFNGTYSIDGVDLGNKNPNTTAHFNIDADVITTSGILGNSASSATFEFTTTGDFYIPTMLFLAIDTFLPSFGNTFTKSVVDLNGSSTQPGDVLTYEFLLKNSGNDPATNVVFSDIAPTGTTIVPGSLEILAGTGIGVFTDATGDDRGDISGSTATIRLGTGATSSTGGQLAVNEEVRFRFSVVVNNSTANNTILSNAASLSYTGLTSGSNLTAQSEAVIGGTTGDALDVTVGVAVPTPAFTPFTVQATATPTITPTPTTTNTPLPTLTATATATQTVTNTPTQTATATPTTIPPTSTPTAAPTSTPTATPTSTPTVAPTTAPGTIVVVVVGDGGVPIPGARVIVGGLGEFIADEKGQVALTGLDSAKSYSISVQRSGVKFDTSTFSITPGNQLTAVGVPVAFNPQSCPSTDLSTNLVSASDVAKGFRAQASERMKMVPAGAQFRLLSGESVSAAALSQRIEAQFQNYLEASKRVPEVLLTCPATTSCTTVDLRSAKRTMSAELNNLSHENLLINRVLRTRGKLTSRRTRADERTIKSNRKQARASLRAIKNSASNCQ